MMSAVVAAAVVGLSLFAVTAAEARPGGDPGRKPTVVLVHGAFADSSGFEPLIRRLVAEGYPVVAAANPLRGLASDAAQVRALLNSIEGPIVLVGHSYGGSVISSAATGNPEVRALVYVAAFAPETAESAEELTNMFPGSTAGESLRPVPLPDEQVDLYIDPKLFPTNFAGDLPVRDAAIYAITQRPATAAAFGEPAAGPQAWHTIPSFYLVAGADRIIPPAAQEFMAERMGAEVQVVRNASHMVFASQPRTTAEFIDKVARKTSR